jgi:hypothetical protein
VHQNCDLGGCLIKRLDLVLEKKDVVLIEVYVKENHIIQE